MITHEEAGVSQQTIQAGLAAADSHRYQVILQRYEPQFSVFHSWTPPSQLYAFDMHNGVGCRVYGNGRCERIVGSTITNTTVVPPGVVRSISLKHVEGTWYWYVVAGSNVYRATSTDDCQTWSSWSLVAGNNPLLVAAVDERFFTLEVSPQMNGVIRYYTPTNPTGITDLTFMSIPRSMDAIRLNNDEAFLALSIDIPGPSSLKVENGETVRFVVASGGILGFKAYKDILSDHIEIDVIERYTAYKYRESVRLSRVGQRLALTCAASDGNQEAWFRSYRVYTAENPEFWSIGRILHGIPNATYHQPLILSGDAEHVYGVTAYTIYRSPSTAMFGGSAERYDVSERLLGYQSQIEDMRQSAALLSDEDGAMLELLSTGNWTCELRLAYGQEPFLLQSIEYVDSIDREEVIKGNEYVRAVRLTLRDLTALMSEYVTVEEPKYWGAQLIGADAYADGTATAYGGLAHTAIQSGTWRTIDNTLLLTANDEEGIVFSTFNSALWNAVAEYAIRLSKANNNEYAGIVFRALDKDNLWHVRYEQAGDALYVYRRVNGQDILITNSGSLGWTNAILQGYKFLRVAFRYAHLVVDTSDDGVTWTNRINYILPGHSRSSAAEYTTMERMIERGFVGCIAKGYSTMVRWEMPGIRLSFAGIRFQGWLPDPSFDFDVPEEEGTSSVTRYIAFVDNGVEQKVQILVLTYGPDGYEGELIDRTPPSATLEELGRIHAIFLSPTNYHVGYLYCQYGIARNRNLWGTNNWTIVYRDADMKGDLGFRYDGWRLSEAGVPPRGTVARRGFWIWSSYNTLYITYNDFKTVRKLKTKFVPLDIKIGPHNRGRRGDIWIAASGEKPGLYRSTNWMRSYQLIADTLIHNGSTVKPDGWTWVDIPRWIISRNRRVPNRQHRHVCGSAARLVRQFPNVVDDMLPTSNWQIDLKRTGVDIVQKRLAQDPLNALLNRPPASWTLSTWPYSPSSFYQGVNWFYNGLLWLEFIFDPPLVLEGQSLTFRLIYSCTSLPFSSSSISLDLNPSGVIGTSISPINIGNNLEWNGTIPTYAPQSIFKVRIYLFAGFSGTLHGIYLEGNGPAPSHPSVVQRSALSVDEQYWDVYLFDLNSPQQSVRLTHPDDPVFYGSYPISWKDSGTDLRRTDNLTDKGSYIYTRIYRSIYIKYSNEYRHSSGVIRSQEIVWRSDRFQQDLSDVNDVWDNMSSLFGNSFETVSNTAFVVIQGYVGGDTFRRFWQFRKKDNSRGSPPSPIQPTRLYAKTGPITELIDVFNLNPLYGPTGAPPVISMVIYPRAIISTDPEPEPERSRPVSLGSFNDDLNFSIPDWEDDIPGIGLWIPGAETALQVSRTRVYDYSPSRSLEEAIQIYANYAGIHRAGFRSRISNATSSTTVGQYNIFSSILPHSYNIAVKPQNLANFELLLNLRSYDTDALSNHHYRLIFAPKVEIWKYIPGTGYSLVYRGTEGVKSDLIEVTVREHIFRAVEENVWLNITVYDAGRMRDTYLEWIKKSPETDYYVGVKGNYLNIRVPELCEIVEWCAVDPGSPVLGGLQRILEGRNINLFMRYDGSIRAYRFLPRSAVWEAQESEVEAYGESINKGQQVTHLRVIGAYLEAEVVRDIPGAHRFLEVKNPYLMTRRACIDEARLVFRKLDEQVQQLYLTTSLRLPLEVDDVIMFQGNLYVIRGYSFNLTPTQIEAQYRLGEYVE